MSLHHNPKIITDGLIMNYDMANTKKSWKGMPTTNQFTLPTAAVNGFGVQNSTFTRIYSGEYGGYDIQASDYVWRYNINGGDCPYHGWDISTPVGTVVTFSFDYYISPTTVGYPSTNYLANFENAGSGVGGAFGDPTPSVIGVWKRAYFSSTATATGNSRCLLYPGACGGALASGTGFILYKNPQVEFNAPGGIPTPFVAGTRSNTQAIIDLTGNNTITATSLTYASDNTFSFNGSNNYMTVPVSSVLNMPSSFTLEAWVRPNSATSDRAIIILGTGSYYLTIDNAYKLSVYCYGKSPAGYHTTSESVSQGVWNHICAAWSSGEVSLYINGQLKISISTTGTPNAVSSQLWIGAEGSGASRQLNGSIGIAKIYNRALSAGEVAQNFNALRGRYGV